MADAMCGPSNALQQFKQQTDVDRTLQQDRLTSRQNQNPAQGFRSHNPNAGLLDPEFEAFQAGLQPPPLLDHAPPFHRPGPAGFGAPVQGPSWAADFQRLQISPQPMQQQPQFHPGPSTSDWAQGFREHIAQTTPKQQTASPSPLAFQQRARGFGNLGFQSSFQQPSYAPAVQSKGKEPLVADQFDEAAFERAFDMAREDMMADVEQTKQEPSVEELVENIEAIAEQSATDMLRQSEQDLEDLSEEPTSRMHTSDIEYEPEQIMQEDQTQQQQQYEDDALAATAQELLEKVEHDQSDKFKNSQFLGLMRKLRDREVRVEGDKMVETATTSSVQNDTLNASSIANSERVYYGKPQPAPLPVTADTRYAKYGQTIPSQEQDHDPGRIDPRDGQEVVDLLNELGSVTDDMAYDPLFSEAPPEMTRIPPSH